MPVTSRIAPIILFIFPERISDFEKIIRLIRAYIHRTPIFPAQIPNRKVTIKTGELLKMLRL
jgi:hypothetical protein